MSVADHFDHTPDAGFVRAYDLHAARRQFQVSVVLILVLTLAAFALGLLVRFDGPTNEPLKPLPAAKHQIHFAGSSTHVSMWRA